MTEAQCDTNVGDNSGLTPLHWVVVSSLLENTGPIMPKALYELNNFITQFE